MSFEAGDFVTTETGLHGRVVHVSRLSAFVELELDGGKEILPFLLSELLRVDPKDSGLAGPSTDH
jgi:preprotein translocase subunit YajC